jgi:hypothetical protein
MMKIRTVLASALLSCAAAAGSAHAAQLTPIPSYDLDRFIGSTVLGKAQAPLGVLSSADPQSGVVAIVGRPGELAYLDGSLLARNGSRIRAPGVSIGEYNLASIANFHSPGTVLVHPQIIIEEPPLG